MLPRKMLRLLPLVALIASCSSSSRESYNAVSDSVSFHRSAAPSAAPGAFTQQSNGATSLTSNASDEKSGAVIPLNSPERKIARTADFHCKVDNVFKTASALERMVRSLGGAVVESNIQNGTPEVKSVYYKPDSLKRAEIYQTSAYMTLKIPVIYLDSVIESIPGMVSFMDSRLLRQTDMSYTYLTNKLKNDNDLKSTAATNAMQLAKKSKESIEVQQYEDGRQQQHIDRQIANLSIMDNVTYATLTLSLSQPEQVFVQTVVNADYVTRTPFAVRFRNACASSWDAVIDLFLGIVDSWPVLLIAIAAWIFLRKVWLRRFGTRAAI